MPRTESIVSPFPAGSGRKMDYTWPDWNANMTGAVTNQIRDRPGAQAASPSGAITGGATGTNNVGVVNGVSCVRFINGANIGGGSVGVVDGAGRIHLSTLKANMKFTNATDDYGAHRVYAIMRMTATPTDALTDCGMCIITGNASNSTVLIGGKPGWLLGFDINGNAVLVQKGNSLVTTTTIIGAAAQGFVNTNYHTFEARFLNATPQIDGLFKVFLDGQFILQRSFGVPADDLPLPTTVGGNQNNGYVVNVQAQSRNCELDVAMVRVQRAPFEQALF